MHSGEVLLLVSIFDRRRATFVTEVVNSDIEVESRLVRISGKSPSPVAIRDWLVNKVFSVLALPVAVV